MEEAKHILEDALLVYSEETHAINTNNGILNEEYLKYHKKQLLKKAISYLTEEVVKHKQSFPQNDLSDVVLTTDFVVLKRKDFDKLVKLIENE
jgi:predicted TIM-barrel enzyme